MSHLRIGYALACLGILITTGGCAESATAPEAASYEASANRFSNPTTADDGAADPVKPKSPTSDADTEVSISGGVILSGGGRADP